jgi:hypothetical protein
LTLRCATKKGEVVLKADGTPKTKQIKRMKDLSQLTPEQQLHPAHGALHRAVAGSVQGFLARLMGLLRRFCAKL